MPALTPVDHFRQSSRNFFALPSVRRSAERRRDARWIADRLAAPGTRIVPVWRWRSLVDETAGSCPVLLPPEVLGDELSGGEAVFLGEHQGAAYFALALPDVRAPEAPLPGAPPGAAFVELRDAGTRMDEWSGALLAYARAMLYWHARHRFCGDCGSPTASAEAGHLRVCTNPDCGQRHFPRTDPAVIVLVTHGDDGPGQRCLLGRQPIWPRGLYSTIAGFVEPGETLEHAVAREVLEEAGVPVGEVRYHSSQPWPFPSSLMLGFTARATGDAIHRRDEELEDARWFTRAELVAALGAGRIRMPRRVSIAFRLVEDWFDHGTLGPLAERVATVPPG